MKGEEGEMDHYSSFEALQEHEREGKDFVILFRPTSSGIALLAPHGGGIEPGTADLADEVARGDHTFYAFKGIKPRGNSLLHITSTRFDEPRALEAAAMAEVAITMHGHHSRREIVWVGGRHVDLMERISRCLILAGFKAEIAVDCEWSAQSLENICNRCRGSRGVQLEVAMGLREKLFSSLERRSWRTRTERFYPFVDAIREAVRQP